MGVFKNSPDPHLVELRLAPGYPESMHSCHRQDIHLPVLVLQTPIMFIIECHRHQSSVVQVHLLSFLNSFHRKPQIELVKDFEMMEITKGMAIPSYKRPLQRLTTAEPTSEKS